MPIVDLITPWAAHSGDFAASLKLHLELIQRQRSPTEPTLPPPVDVERLSALARDSSLQQRLLAVRNQLSDRGYIRAKKILLVASSAPGAVAEPLPTLDGNAVALFLDRGTELELRVGLAGAIAALTRWQNGASLVRPFAAKGSWDRWMAAREVPLAEWYYTEGLAVHAAAESFPELQPHQLLGLNRGSFNRLRRDEQALRRRLEADLWQSGAGVVLRWLGAELPLALSRGVDGSSLPRGAGRYLAWRDLNERVARIGVLAACGSSLQE